MGNIVQCCHTLSNYFKCKDAPPQAEEETSPLLSSEDSEYESQSLLDDLEDDVLSTSVTNPALEPEHSLFPDIILSSSLGGGVTLVEPMVCLLVSEDGRDEALRVDEPADEERSNTGRNRVCSEVETQTEAETQIGMVVQTQTESQAEVQTQTEILEHNNETEEREVHTLTNTGTSKEMTVDVKEKITENSLKQVDVHTKSQSSYTSQWTHSEVVVGYLGIHVIAQAIVPGILEKNQEQSVVYGSNDCGEMVFTHPSFLELLDKTSKPQRLQRHQVLADNNSPVELCSGIETKGILGNDGQPYTLDLLRTFPPDLNFLFSETKVVEEEVPKECQSFAFPHRHPHGLASLRPELIEAFVQPRYELYVKILSPWISQLKVKNKFTEQIDDSVCETRTGDTATADADMGCCKVVGSVSDSYFDIHFNPDVCSRGVRFSSKCFEEVWGQRQLLWEAAVFLLSSQIPAVLKDCLDHTAVPMDGATLTSVLHQRGVNVRYLGTLLQELDRVEEKGRLSHIERISVSEVIIRSAKHIFRTYLQDVEPAAFSAAISHFLNCLLGSSSCFPDSCPDELLSRRMSQRCENHGSRTTLLTDIWARLTPGELWGRIRTEAEDYYHYTLHSKSIYEVMEKYSLQRISLLREMAIKTSIQFSTPNLLTILQQLNLICGIILIPLSAKEVADL